MSALAAPGTRLYARSYQLQLGTPDQPAQATYGNTGSDAPLRVAFSVKKGIKQSPNKATVSISNLAPKNRGIVQAGFIVTLSAGYLGAVSTLFVGIVAKATSKREGPDITTELECGDGEAAITQATLSRSYPRGTALVQVITDIANAMQLTTSSNFSGLTQGTLVAIPQKVYSKGLVVHGPCARTLTRLCQTAGLHWSVQDGALQILPYAAVVPQTAEVVSPATGLIGVPSRNGQTVAFSSLLNPNLAPGRLVYLKSSAVTGYFKITGGSWDGDSHADKWSCDLEASELPGVVIGLDTSLPFDLG